MRCFSNTWLGLRAVVALVVTAAAACVGGGWSVAAASRPADTTPADAAIRQWVRYPSMPDHLSPQAELGKRLFFDTTLSASKRMSCASCHSPAHAYGPPNGRAVQLGGPKLDRPGTRAVPSLRYLAFTPSFHPIFLPSS